MILNGFIQVSTKLGSFFCKSVDMGAASDGFIVLSGPNIVTLTMIQDPQTKRPQRLWNKDKVNERYLNKDLVLTIDTLNPADLDKDTKEVYESLSGIQLM